jgi:hypothetical protein
MGGPLVFGRYRVIDAEVAALRRRVKIMASLTDTAEGDPSAYPYKNLSVFLYAPFDRGFKRADFRDLLTGTRHRHMQ